MSNHTVNDYRDPFQTFNATVTNLSYRAKDLWKSPEGTAIRIEVFVVLAVVVFLFLATFGSHRRNCTNWFIQKGVFVAYIASFPLAIYIVGSMQSSATKSSMYLIWVLCLFILHGCTDSVTAYSLDDNTQVIRLMYQIFMCCAYVGGLLVTLVSLPNLSKQLSPAFSILYVIAFSKYCHRITVYILASSSWNSNKMVADYMYNEHKKGAFDPTTMKGCHYLVDWPLSKCKLLAPSYVTQLTANADEIIDIDKIWRCNARSLDPELKDTCLSFSLFHLLKRRFFGFSCGESKERAHDFVFKGLLSKNKDGVTDHNRVFKVIETELAFLYDFFFTKYALVYYGSNSPTVWALLSFAACVSVAIDLPARHVMRVGSVQDGSIIEGTTTADAVITLLILSCTALLELLQLLLYWMSIWARVSFVCQHIRDEEILNRRGSRYMMRLKELLTKVGVYYASDKHYWKHKLGQFSLLEAVSYDPDPSKKLHKGVKKDKFFRSLLSTIYCFDFLHVLQRHSLARKIRSRPGKPIELPAEIKEALIHSLKHTDGKLTNGKSSLQSNEAEFLLWACEQDSHSDSSCSQRNDNQTRLILTWHIATCYCEMATPRPNEGTKFKLHADVATKLSKYCAHLVVSAPKFLPGHHYDTALVFDAVAVETAKFLETSRDKYEAMRNSADSGDTIFQSGVKLGKQLERIHDVTRRWKVLADFWAEVMLYVAPSDNVKKHIGQLAKGGEFITHLWALLSHAGILERDQQNPSRPNPADHQETKQDSKLHELAATVRRRTAVDPLPCSDWAPPPSPGVPEIAAGNERRIDVPESSRSIHAARTP